MKTLFKDRYNQDKFIVGMVHTLALPRSPMYDRTGGMKKLVKQERKEAKILVEAGFHSLMYCNESDMPYMGTMKPETVTAMFDLVDGQTLNEVDPTRAEELMKIFNSVHA